MLGGTSYTDAGSKEVFLKLQEFKRADIVVAGEPARARHLMTAVKLAGATPLNRLVVVRQMETLGLARVRLVTGG